MSQIQKGYEYGSTSPSNIVTEANLEALVDDAILLPGAITDQTELTTPAGDDTVLISDTSAAAALRKVQLNNLLPVSAITSKTTVTAASDDVLLLSDTSDSGNLKKVLVSDLPTPGTITGKTELTLTAIDDLVLVSDTSAAAASVKVQLSNLIPDGGLRFPKLDTDFMVDVTLKATPTTADLLLIADAAATNLTKKATVLSILGSAAAASAATALSAGAMITLAHGFGTTPRHVYAVLVCVTADEGYVTGDEIDVANIYSGADDRLKFQVKSNATNAILICRSTSNMRTLHGSTGALSADLTAGNWNAKIYARI